MNALNSQVQKPILDITHLKVTFPTRDGVVAAINDLNMQVCPGEIVGIVGESGCGKSTAALAIMRLLQHPGRISGGSILFENQDLAKISEREMSKLRGSKIAMIFQDALAALDPRMTIGSQLCEPLRLHLRLTAQQARQRAIELLEDVGISSAETRFGQYPHEFSGGMRQRVMIAIALSCEPKLLIADEPTTALDVTVQRQILELILRMRDRTRTAVVLITHDVGVVGEVCDRVAVLYAGRIVEIGATQTVFTQPTHPYTAGLLASTIKLDGDRDKPLNAIPGLPPELTHLPHACAFAPRCAHATDQCREQIPQLEYRRAGQESACWHPRNLTP